MGNGETKSSHRLSKLTEGERQALEAAINLSEVKGCLSEDVIIKKLSFPTSNLSLLSAIYALFAHGKKNVGIADLCLVYETVMFGVLEDHARIITFLMNQSNLPKEELCKWLVQSAQKISPDWEHWQKIGCEISENSQNSLVEFLCHDHNGDKFADTNSWLSRRPQIISLLKALFRHGFRCPVEDECKVILFPEILELDSTGPCPSALTSSEVLFLNSILPHDLACEWRLLFSTARHGQSFSKFVSKIVDQYPTLMIVKDMDGHIFGGFASVKWTVGPNFAGDQRCFLFSIRPKMAVYASKGYNDHYMYLNQQQATLPNGLGMGGQHEYFALWLDAEFGIGRSSKTCTTYSDYHQLSKNEKFEIDHLEVWRVGKPPRRDSEDEEEESNQRSILDRDPGAKALLEMIDRGHNSEGLREPEPE